MPTILLQEIRDFLYAVLTAMRSIIEHIDSTLDAVKEDTDAIKDSTADIKTNTDGILEDTESIDTHTTNIDTNLSVNIPTIVTKLDTINDSTTSLDSKATTVLQDLNSLIDTNTAIKNNTGAVVTPIARINENVATMLLNSNDIKADIDDINLKCSTIASATGATSAFCEDIATNTLNSYNKLVTISEDTTQMRADNSTMINILNSILLELRGE